MIPHPEIHEKIFIASHPPRKLIERWYSFVLEDDASGVGCVDILFPDGWGSQHPSAHSTVLSGKFFRGLSIKKTTPWKYTFGDMTGTPFLRHDEA
jgi:hypothetical protein